MNAEEAIKVFEQYLNTGQVPNPYELQEASKLAIKALKTTIHEVSIKHRS